MSERKVPPLWRCLISECVGTFALTSVDCGGAVMQAIGKPGEVTPESRSLATGLIVAAMIYSFGGASGAHINPAVTVGFALRGAFPWSRVSSYIVAQLLGALAAPAILLATFGPVAELGATTPQHGQLTALLFEVLLTGFLVTVVLSTATRYRVLGPNAALAVGATVALCGLFARPGSGASMNPARSFGPAVLSGNLDSYWIYVVGPLLGAVAAVVLVTLVHGPAKDEEDHVAQGDE